MQDPAFEIIVSLMNQKVQFQAVSHDNPDRPVTFDYIPPHGDGQGYKGLELLLMSFSGCVSTAIVFLLRKAGRTITSYQMEVEGIRRENPLSLQKIRAHIKIKSSNIEDADMQDAIKKASQMSPVWISLNPNIEVDLGFTVIH